LPYFPLGLYDAKKEKPNLNIGSFSRRVNQNPYHDAIPQLRVQKVDPWPPMIWQGCLQSFIKRIIKMVCAIIDIPNNGPFRRFHPMQIALRGFRPAFAEAATRRQV